MKKILIYSVFILLIAIFAIGAVVNSQFRGFSEINSPSLVKDDSLVKQPQKVKKPQKIISKKIQQYRFSVIFDQSNEQVYSPFDTSFTGMSEFAAIIRKNGGSVSINNEALSNFLPQYTKEYKEGERILVLGVSMFRKYAKEDISAVLDFLKSGGNVFLMVEHDDLMGNGTFQNQILGEFGIKALPVSSSTKDRTQKNPHWPYCKAESLGLDQVQPFLPAPLVFEEESDAAPFMKIIDPVDQKLETVAAIDRSLGGTLFVLGDAELVWNGIDIIGIESGQNRLFIDKVIKLLAKVGANSDFGRLAQENIYSSQESSKKALFDNSSLGMVPGAYQGINNFSKELSKSGYQIDIGGGKNTDYSEYDLVILSQPLEKQILTDEILKANKLLIIADGQADYLETKEIRKILSSISGKDVTSSGYYLNKLTEKLGFKFLSTTLVKEKLDSNKDTHFIVESVWRDSRDGWNLMRSAVIDTNSLSPNGKYLVLADSFAGSWESRNITPKQSLKKKPVMPFIPPKDLDRSVGMPVVIASENVFAVADIDIFLDQQFSSNGGKNLFLVLSEWLND